MPSMPLQTPVAAPSASRYAASCTSRQCSAAVSHGRETAACASTENRTLGVGVRVLSYGLASATAWLGAAPASAVRCCWKYSCSHGLSAITGPVGATPQGLQKSGNAGGGMRSEQWRKEAAVHSPSVHIPTPNSIFCVRSVSLCACAEQGRGVRQTPQH